MNPAGGAVREFEGRVVVVSGAAQGIGAAVAERFARSGAVVAALDRQAALLQQCVAALNASELSVRAYTVDVSAPLAVEAAVKRVEAELGAIEVLVNVAGVLVLAPVAELRDEDWRRCFAVNADGVFHLSRAVARRMQPRGRGAIVTVGSNAAAVPRQGMAAYAASKAAAAMFTQCLGLELAPQGIRCNIVSPGSTDTAMQRQLWDGDTLPQAVLHGAPESFRTGIPLGRIAQPEDIAEAVLYLASERARHITLHDLRVDGGATLGA